MKINNVTKTFEVNEVCPVCGKVHKAVYWCIDHSDNEDYYCGAAMHRIGQPNGFFLCKHCGYFRREFDRSFPVEGITIFSEGRALGRQLRTLKECKSNAEGLQILDVAPFKMSVADFGYTDINAITFRINPEDFDYINEGVFNTPRQFGLEPTDVE